MSARLLASLPGMLRTRVLASCGEDVARIMRRRPECMSLDAVELCFRNEAVNEALRSEVVRIDESG